MGIYLALMRQGWTVAAIDESDFLFLLQLMAYSILNLEDEERGYINEVMGC